jgi:outer membrane lipoprotein-sorting protein
MKILINIFLLISCFHPYNGNAQSEAEDILARLQENFESIKDLSADITQSINGKTNLSGRIYYKRENKLRFDLERILIVSDGETNWNHNKKENKVIISNYEEEDAGLFSIELLVFDYPEECELSTYVIDDQVVLNLEPQTSTLSFNNVKLWISEENLITRALIDDSAIGLTQLDIGNYKINQNLNDSFFTYSPPEGSQIIDLR